MNLLSKNIVRLLFLFCIVLASSCKKSDPTPVRPDSPRKIKGVVSYSRTFNDLNEKHLIAARKWGVKPIQSREDADKHTQDLTLIESNDWYEVDRLTHSIPFLVPRANELLDIIAKNFQDSINAKWLEPNKIVVTSVLRTIKDVKNLNKTNANASMNSAHFYGTTFDISWKRFKTIEKQGEYETLTTNETKLKNVLCEVLRDLQKSDRCYVKYEKKQACFHITTR